MINPSPGELPVYPVPVTSRKLYKQVTGKPMKSELELNWTEPCSDFSLVGLVVKYSEMMEGD